MLKRIIRMVKESRKADRRRVELEKLLKTEKDKEKLFFLTQEYENLGFMRIVICEKCKSYRSDLEWREKSKEGINCVRCGSNKIMYPPKIPLRVILQMASRFVIKGY